MAVALAYTEGVIAVREKYLLKDRVLRLCEMTAGDAFRSLLEYGYGGGAETAQSIYDYEKLIEREERALDEFILEFAPSKADAAYLLAPRDFHNAKALLKARILGENADKMLATRGLVDIATIASCVNAGKYADLADTPELCSACEQVEALLEGGVPSGREIGLIFERAQYAFLLRNCRKSRSLKASIVAKIDMTNLLTAFRAVSFEDAATAFIGGGKLKEADIEKAVSDGWKDGVAFEKYPEFLGLCKAAKEKGAPLTLAEKYRDAFDVEKLAENRYELKRDEPFLYYVLSRKAENANVRIIFALQLLGASEQEMKKRLRGI